MKEAKAREQKSNDVRSRRGNNKKAKGRQTASWTTNQGRSAPRHAHKHAQLHYHTHISPKLIWGKQILATLPNCRSAFTQQGKIVEALFLQDNES